MVCNEIHVQATIYNILYVRIRTRILQQHNSVMTHVQPKEVFITQQIKLTNKQKVYMYFVFTVKYFRWGENSNLSRLEYSKLRVLRH